MAIIDQKARDFKSKDRFKSYQLQVGERMCALKTSLRSSTQILLAENVCLTSDVYLELSQVFSMWRDSKQLVKAVQIEQRKLFNKAVR